MAWSELIFPRILSCSIKYVYNFWFVYKTVKTNKQKNHPETQCHKEKTCIKNIVYTVSQTFLTKEKQCKFSNK